MIEAKRVYSILERPEIRREVQKTIREATKKTLEKERLYGLKETLNGLKETLAKFEEKVGAEQLAENIKLYLGIKK